MNLRSDEFRHPDESSIARYAAGGDGLDDAAVWSIEAHLDTCADCRVHLAGRAVDSTTLLLDRVAGALDRAIAVGPAPARRPRPWAAVQRRWLVWLLLPWLTTTVAVVGVAALLNVASPTLPSLVLLLAPVAPLPGVAAAWSRRLDPAWEALASTPAAGLGLMLRRTAVVLAVVVPALLLAGAGTGTSLALVLLPCLAFTAATVALGAFVGVRRAALGLGAAWLAGVLGPGLATSSLPALLRPGSTAAWALATVALIGLAAAGAPNFRRLSSGD